MVIRVVQCGASELLLQLFSSHATSPQPHVWHSHFFCLDNDCHLFKFLLQHSKTVALVQSEFEFKRGHIFVVAKIGQTNFVKSRKIQGLRIPTSWNFVPCVFFSKFPQRPFSMEIGTVLVLGEFLCIRKWCNQFWVTRGVAKDF